MTRRPEPPQAALLRLAIAEVIRAILRTPDGAERAALVKRRNELGRELAALTAK